MENTSQQSATAHNQRVPLQPVAPPQKKEPVANKKLQRKPDQNRHVTAILESTRRIRSRTDNREIHAILDEIVWLARSI